MPEKCRWIYSSGKNKGLNCVKNGIHNGWCNDHKINGPLKQGDNAPPPAVPVGIKPAPPVLKAAVAKPRKVVEPLPPPEEPQVYDDEEYDDEYNEDGYIDGDGFTEDQPVDEYDDGGGVFGGAEEDLTPAQSTLGSEIQAKAQKEVTRKEKMKKVDAKAKELKKIESIKKTAAKLGDPKLMKEVQQVERMQEPEDLEEPGAEDDLPYLDEGMDPAEMAERTEMMKKQERGIRSINRLAPAIPLTIETVWTTAIEPQSGISMQGLYRTCIDDPDVKEELQDAFMDCLDEFGFIKKDDIHNLPATSRLAMALGGAMFMTANKNLMKDVGPLSDETKKLADKLDD